MLMRILLLAACVLGPAVMRAEEPLTAPDPTRVRLLDEVPNYPTILRDQWSSGVPADTFEREQGNYGLLSETAGPRPITLEESIALALENNTGLRIQRLSPIAATARVRQAYAQFDPQIFGDANTQRSVQPVGTINAFTNDDAPDIFNAVVNWNVGARKRLLTGGVLTGEWTNQRLRSDANFINLLQPAYDTTLGLSLVQPLLRDFGWRFSLLIVDVAQIREEQAYYDYRAQVTSLVENVERGYWAYVLAIETVRVEEKGLDLARELLRQNEGRFKVGALPRTSVLESEAEVARREATMVRSRAFERIARDNLRALINAKEGKDALLMIQPVDKPTVVKADLDLTESLKIAYTQRPELVAARLDIDGRQVEQKIAQNRLLPRLDLVGSIGLNGLGGDNSGVVIVDEDGNIQSQANPQVFGGYSRSLELLTDTHYYQYLVGARIEIPIANASAKAEYAQAKVNSEAARLSLEQTEETVTLEITQAINNLNALIKSIEATRIARELAAENVRNQQARFEIGRAHV